MFFEMQTSLVLIQSTIQAVLPIVNTADSFCLSASNTKLESSEYCFATSKSFSFSQSRFSLKKYLIVSYNQYIIILGVRNNAYSNKRECQIVFKSQYHSLLKLSYNEKLSSFFFTLIITLPRARKS